MFEKPKKAISMHDVTFSLQLPPTVMASLDWIRKCGFPAQKYYYSTRIHRDHHLLLQHLSLSFTSHFNLLLSFLVIFLAMTLEKQNGYF